MRRRWLMVSLFVALALVAATAVTALILASRASGIVRARLVALLETRLESKVELGNLAVHLWPRLRVEGERLVIRHHGRTDVPPLIEIPRFAAETGWRDAFSKPRRVRRMRVEGLSITIPPRGTGGPRRKEGGGCQAGDRSTTVPEDSTPSSSPVMVDEFVALDTQLTLLPRSASKTPRVFLIHAVSVRGLTMDRPMAFEATLTNPKPRGEIKTTGTFGPWQGDSPGLSPVSGRYQFENADLATIKGIGGMLASTGEYRGLLEQILVKGKTRVPDFSLKDVGRPMPLEATFDACVDGTDGDTYLDRVEAMLATTPILAKGKVEGTVGVKGRTIALDASIDDGRIEDLLHLAVKDERPLMTGRVSLTTKFLLRPGEEDVIRRLWLRGTFGVEQTRFSSGGVQGKINELSRRGRGDVKDPTADSVVSDLRGRFELDRSVMTFSSLTFAVPGAAVRLHGSYGLESEAVDFNGTIRLQAKVSETVTGFKSLLLKAVDPLFARKGAGTVLPIWISGTKDKPQFGVEVKSAILRKAK